MTIYDTPEWQMIREQALKRDGGCVIGQLIGIDCEGPLDGHHKVPIEEGGAFEIDNVITLCHSHHPMLEGFRRRVLRFEAPVRCGHNHRYEHARRECHERIRRQRLAA